MKKIFLTAIITQVTVLCAFSQLKTNENILSQTARLQREKETANFQAALKLAHERGWELAFKTKNGNMAYFIGLDNFRYPVYYSTENIVVAFATTRANVLWAGRQQWAEPRRFPRQHER